MDEPCPCVVGPPSESNPSKRPEAMRDALRAIGELTVAEHAKGNITFEVANKIAGIVEAALR
jgi:hypothetical protein